MQPGANKPAPRALRDYARALASQAAKLRPALEKLRPALRKLRHVLDKLHPVLEKLRALVVNAVDAAGRGLERGNTRLARVAPRAALRLQAAGTWVGASEQRKLGAAALALLALVLVLAALLSGSTGRYVRVLFAPSQTVPLPGGIRAAADDRAKQLAAALEARTDRRGKFAGEAWTSAQVLIALGGRDAGAARVKAIEQYFRSVEGPECACWRRQPRGEFPNHVGVTAWALWAMASYGIAAQRAELEFLLSIQRRDGAWPQFAGAKEERFASSYGTAAAILALHEQAGLEAHRPRAKRIRAAVDLGAGWLKGRAIGGGARWADYPAWPEAGERAEFLGLSGFVLFALHRVGAPDLAALDRDWLARLPADAPDALAGGVSRKTVQVGKRSYRDDTRYSALPWAILATAVVYPGASLSGKVRAMEWIECALAPGTSIHALTGKERNLSVPAEALLALRGGA